jgi:hypothetical protein
MIYPAVGHRGIEKKRTSPPKDRCQYQKCGILLRDYLPPIPAKQGPVLLLHYLQIKTFDTDMRLS